MREVNLSSSSPEDWLRLGYALGSREKGIRIGVAGGEEEPAKLAAETIKIGARCAGAEVYFFGVQNLPIMRSGSMFYKTELGAYAAYSKDDNRVNITVLDKDGIQLPSDAIKEWENIKAEEGGVENDLSEFKTYYIRNIINSVRSDRFNINMCLSTKSKTASGIIEAVLRELYSRLEPEAAGAYEFSGMVSEDGERIILVKSDGTQLTREQTISVMVYVLLKDSGLRTFVLPEFMSQSAETAILKMGGNVIRCGNEDSEIMKKIVAAGGAEQLLMMYDGIYAAVRILDFLNINGVSFDGLCANLPRVFKAEAEVEWGKNSNVVDMLKRQYNSSPFQGGVKIQTNGGVTMIFTPQGSNIIKIISEADSMEAAEEISTLFKNKIKKLAKS